MSARARKPVPLSVLDLVPIAAGETGADAIHHSVDLARHAERLGYHRYWFAEHHLNPGVAGTDPATMISLVAAATSTSRVGSGGVQLGHRTPLSVVEEFGILDSVYPGRIDLGLGRTLGTPRRRPEPAEPAGSPGAPGAWTSTTPPSACAPCTRSTVWTRAWPGSSRATSAGGRWRRPSGPRSASARCSASWSKPL